MKAGLGLMLQQRYAAFIRSTSCANVHRMQTVASVSTCLQLRASQAWLL